MAMWTMMRRIHPSKDPLKVYPPMLPNTLMNPSCKTSSASCSPEMYRRMASIMLGAKAS